jgi:hypothetical protein
MYMIKLEWKEFNVDLAALDVSLRVSYPNYKGNQAQAHLELWFDEEPSQQAKDDIQAMWDAIADNSAMATSYQSAAQVKAASDAKKESAKAKLLALGLSVEELKAILG